MAGSPGERRSYQSAVQERTEVEQNQANAYLAACPWSQTARRVSMETPATGIYVRLNQNALAAAPKAVRGEALSWSLAPVHFSTLDSEADVP